VCMCVCVCLCLCVYVCMCVCSCVCARVVCALVRVSFISSTSRVEWELLFGEILSEVQGQGSCFFALSLFHKFLSA